MEHRVSEAKYKHQHTIQPDDPGPILGKRMLSYFISPYARRSAKRRGVVNASVAVARIRDNVIRYQDVVQSGIHKQVLEL